MIPQRLVHDYASYFRRLGGWVGIFAITYLVYVGALFFMQNKLIYFPEAAPFSPAVWELREFSYLPVTTPDKLELRSWYVLPRDADKFTIVFFQGNRGNFGRENYKIRSWIAEGYGVLLVGYRGYGNPGVPSENGLYADARATIAAFREQAKEPEERLVLYGQSLGTGIAVQMAKEFKNVGGLILQSPYTSIPDIGQRSYPFVPVRFLVKDRYDTLAKIADVHVPLLVLHGEADRVVPVEMGRQVFKLANEPKQAVFLVGRGHNNIYTEQAQQAVRQFIEKLPTDAFIDKTSPEKTEG